MRATVMVDVGVDAVDEDGRGRSCPSSFSIEVRLPETATSCGSCDAVITLTRTGQYLHSLPHRLLHPSTIGDFSHETCLHYHCSRQIEWSNTPCLLFYASILQAFTVKGPARFLISNIDSPARFSGTSLASDQGKSKPGQAQEPALSPTP